MPREHYNAFEYYLNKIGIREQILKVSPQCKDCEYMEFWGFVPRHFVDTVSKKYCPSCSKYDGNEWVLDSWETFEKVVIGDDSKGGSL